MWSLCGEFLIGAAIALLWESKLNELSPLRLAGASEASQTDGYRFQSDGRKVALPAFANSTSFILDEPHLTESVPRRPDQKCNSADCRRSEHHRPPRCCRAWTDWGSSLHAAASSFEAWVRGEAPVLRGEWMNGGIMEMRKRNGTLSSIPAAGTVALCLFHPRHERRTISLSAINNMVSFEADYPSVWLKANKRPGDNRQESAAKVFTYPEEHPPFCFVSILKKMKSVNVPTCCHTWKRSTLAFQDNILLSLHSKFSQRQTKPSSQQKEMIFNSEKGISCETWNYILINKRPGILESSDTF